MPDDKRPLKVFLCHAHADKAQARDLYRTLKRRGLQPWLDAEDLLPGQAWQVEIPKALETSDAIIILLSKTSVDKEGYVQKEIKFALDKALEMPEGRIFLIPARLEECDVPRSISGYQWVDLFEQGGYDKLMRSLRLRATQLQRTLKPGNKEPEKPIAIEMLGTISSDQGPSPESRPNRLKKSDVIASIPPHGVVPSSSLRLKQVLALINDAKNALEKITVPRVAHLLGISTISEIEACFEGKAEASVTFLEKFADFFGVNHKWLLFGEGHPFETIESSQIYPIDYYPRIKSLKPRETIFVREVSKGRTTILLILADFNYIYFPNEFRVGSDIGELGRKQLISLYDLIEKIDSEDLPYSSRQVSTKDFDEFTDGDIFPGKIVNLPVNYWATDFLSSDFDIDDEEKYDLELRQANRFVISEKYKKSAQDDSGKHEKLELENGKSETIDIKSEVHPITLKEKREELLELEQEAIRYDQSGDKQKALQIYRDIQRTDILNYIPNLSTKIMALELELLNASKEKPDDKKDEKKPPRKLKTEYIIAIIGAAATIVAALKGVLPQIIGPVLKSSQTPIRTITFVTSSQTEIADDKGVKMQFVPAGEFTMGSTAADALAKCKKYNSLCDQNWFTDEEPVHRITLNAFYIDKFEVTNSHYKLCVDSGTCKTPHSVSSSSHLAYFGNAEFGDYPVIYVDWYMAKQYCEWRGARLPTEAEFEKAARGADGRTYPWGENNDNTRANYAQYPGGDVTKVGSYPNGISIFGVHDLSGNVWEWVSSLYKPYPYSATDNREDLNAIDLRVLRGGGWSNSEYSVRVTARRSNEPLGNYPDVGFRCVRDGQP